MLLSFVLATLVPYLWNNPDALAALTRRGSAFFTSVTAARPPGAGSPAFVSSPPLDDNSLGLAPNLVVGLDELKLEGVPVADFGELFRFDITPDWVTQRWSRVTTVAAENGWQGLRVPVVTGTQVDDLAGSLTYYFDSLNSLQRITFKGATGDARRLIAWTTRVAGLKREPTLAAELYTRRWSGRPTSVLALQRQPVMRSDAAHGRLEVLLELSNPKNRAGVSPEVQEWLALNRA